MKLNAVRAFILASLVIILFYALGLFLPIIMTSKESSINLQINEIIIFTTIQRNNHFVQLFFVSFLLFVLF